MADTAIAITAGAGTNIDTRTESTNSNHRQVIVVGDPTSNTGVAAVKDASTAPVATDPALVVAISPNSVNSNGQKTMANSAPVVIASDQSNVPFIAGVSASANNLTDSRVVAAATTNATNLKASAGKVYTVDVFNVAAYTVFLKFYDKASSPTVGPATPVWTVPIPAGAGYSKTFYFGKTFPTGVSYAITKLQADSDTTVLVAGDVTGFIGWI